MSPRAATARAREAPSTRDAILDAAERRFAERGFAGVSMREIAAEAGLKNQASLYHHFRHKRALYEAVLARGIAPIIALVAESGRGGPAGERGRLEPAVVEAVLDRVLDYLEEHSHLPRLIQRAACWQAPAADPEARHAAPRHRPRESRPLRRRLAARGVRSPAGEGARLLARGAQRAGLLGGEQVPRRHGRPARLEDVLLRPR